MKNSELLARLHGVIEFWLEEKAIKKTCKGGYKNYPREYYSEDYIDNLLKIIKKKGYTR